MLDDIERQRQQEEAEFGDNNFWAAPSKDNEDLDVDSLLEELES